MRPAGCWTLPLRAGPLAPCDPTIHPRRVCDPPSPIRCPLHRLGADPAWRCDGHRACELCCAASMQFQTVRLVRSSDGLHVKAVLNFRTAVMHDPAAKGVHLFPHHRISVAIDGTMIV